MIDDKILSSKTNSNTWLSVAVNLDSKEFILKKSNYRRSIGNFIAFPMNILNIDKYKIEDCCSAYYLSFFLTGFFGLLGFISRSSSL